MQRFCYDKNLLPPRLGELTTSFGSGFHCTIAIGERSICSSSLRYAVARLNKQGFGWP